MLTTCSIRPHISALHVLIMLAISIVACCFISSPAFAAEYDELRSQADQAQAELDACTDRIGELDAELSQLAAEHERLENEKMESSEQLGEYARIIYRERNEIVSDLVEAFTSFEDVPTLVRTLEALEAAFNRPYEQARAVQDLIYENEQGTLVLQQEKASLEQEAGERGQVASALQEQAQAAWETVVATQNNAMAIAACRISYSQPVFYDPDKVYGGTEVALKTAKSVKVGGVRACSLATAIAARWSGVDTGMPSGCTGQWNHMEGSSSWVRVGRWNGDISTLQPGDVLLRVNGLEGQTIDHSCVYVGHEIVEQVYNTYLKGTDADLGEPPADACFVSAHGTKNKSAAPCVGNAKWAYADKRMTVFRCVAPENAS